jgi:hypothetical protein
MRLDVELKNKGSGFEQKLLEQRIVSTTMVKMILSYSPHCNGLVADILRTACGHAHLISTN